jgi:hypothetical protein
MAITAANVGAAAVLNADGGAVAAAAAKVDVAWHRPFCRYRHTRSPLPPPIKMIAGRWRGRERERGF